MEFIRRVIVALIFAAPSACWAGEKPALNWIVNEEIIHELKTAPRDNRERVDRIRELYVQAGAAAEDIVLQPVQLGDRADTLQHNVICTKRGTTNSVIVVGGHLDKVPPGDGIIDDWSGAALATNLYQTLRPLQTHHTFVFIGFAHEESGLVGSRLYVNSLSDEERKQIKAMVNLEVLGVADPFLWTNGSTDSLEVLAHLVAIRNNLPLRDHVIRGVGADSIPFEKAGIPNITFDGLPIEKMRLIHSDHDTFENIDPQAYLNTYRLTAEFLVALDRELGDNPDLLSRLDPSHAEKRVDEYVEAEMKKHHIPGASVAVVRRGRVVLSKGYGKANVELDVPAIADSVYQVGSITKPFTATAIMMLVEEGKLSLDAPISTYLSDLPEAWGAVTVRHLLNHTSGIKSYTNMIENMAVRRLDRTQSQIIKTLPAELEFTPGEKWAYNNSGYFLLGMIIEKVSEQDYATFLDERIFKPLGMTATRVNDPRAIIPNRATGYTWTGKTLRNGEFLSMTMPFSAGAVVSTVNDLAKWEAALYAMERHAITPSVVSQSGATPNGSTTPLLLKTDTLKQMWLPSKLAGDSTKDYGLGWALGTHRDRRILGHGGGINGFATDYVRFPDDHVAVIMLTNLENASPGPMTRRIAALYIPDLVKSEHSSNAGGRASKPDKE